MRNTNGQNACLNSNHSKTVHGSLLIESKISNSLTVAEAEFLDFIKSQGIDELIHSLKMVHDFALYHSDLCFDAKEKNALFNLKVLWEGLEALGKS